ncbi:MAG: thioredoxin family protein [Longimonas sp.]|uniref:thioredoxin family protein n=1 Tax=Longimonas sp. TaxID=2039626 RepID=UPI0039747FEB
MAAVESHMLELGTKAPDFDLPIANPEVDDLDGDRRALDDYDDASALVVMFICNHCPYVHHVEPALVETARVYGERGAQFVAICANDAENYPDDSFEKMTERAEEKEYPFPYLQDETQEVAKAYQAACTPDFYVFNKDRELVYRGRYDETRPNNGMAHGQDLHAALDAVLNSGTLPDEQHPSMGCSIKWKPGNAPA